MFLSTVVLVLKICQPDKKQEYLLYTTSSAKNNIMLDDDDKLELMESITLKGMGGDDALIEVS